MVYVCYSDKHSKRARDMHLLKQLKLLLKEQVAENGMLSKNRCFTRLIHVVCNT